VSLLILSCNNEEITNKNTSVDLSQVKKDLDLNKFSNVNIAENLAVDWETVKETQKGNFKIAEIQVHEQRASTLESNFLENHIKYQIATIESKGRLNTYFIEAYTNKGSIIYPGSITKLNDFTGTLNVFLLNGHNLGSVALYNGRARNISENDTLNVLAESINAFANKSDTTNKIPQCGGNYTVFIDQTLSRFDVWTVGEKIVAINYLGTTTIRTTSIMPLPCDGVYDKNDILNQRLELYTYKDGSNGVPNASNISPPSCESFSFVRKNGANWQEALVKNVSFRIILLTPPNHIEITQIISYPLKDLNAKKISPFLKKKSIEIPSKLVDTYFKNFIPEIAKKIDIEATGFEIEHRDKITSCTLQPVYDFFKNGYYITLCFDYDGYLFDANKTKTKHNFVDFSISNEPRIIQHKRNSDENLYTNKLLEIGLLKIKNELFGCTSKEEIDDPYVNIQFIIDHKEELKNLGFATENLKLESKEIRTEKAIISSSTATTKEDWFDVKIIITSGTFTFSFSEIIANIKSKERLFLLPDGTYFLIPLEWLTKYSSLAKLVKREDGNLLLRKNNFAVLDAIPEIETTAPPIYKAEYIPSDVLKATLRPYQIDGVKWLLGHLTRVWELA
jgi:hypothetical protein